MDIISEQERSRRDPKGRRDNIIKATASLIVENGPDSLTHRQIAARANVPIGSTTYYFSSLGELTSEALRYLADGIDKFLEGIASELDKANGDLMVLAELIHAYLYNRTQLLADSALYIAAIQKEELRSMALRWFDGLVTILSHHTNRNTAIAIAVFSDGAIVHASLHEEPLDLPFIQETLASLLKSKS